MSIAILKGNYVFSSIVDDTIWQMATIVQSTTARLSPRWKNMIWYKCQTFHWKMISTCSCIFVCVSGVSGAFRLYDVDNDGFITRDEMYNIVDAIYQMVVRRFRWWLLNSGVT
jgi:hypothetical protein